MPLRYQGPRCRSAVRVALAGVLFAFLACFGAASAQTLSGKPIRIVVPVAAGAATDILGRIAGEWIGRRTGLPVVIENRTGAGGNIALEQVARGEPDGHTLLVATNGAITINRALYKKVAIDTLADIVPVAPLASFSNILVVNSALPVRGAQEFIALARAKPGTLAYGSAGLGTTPHLGLALFARLAGIELVHVPYRGMAPAVTDLLAGNVQAVAVGYATVAPFVQQGLLRVIAVAAQQRLPYLPGVPSAAEIGLPGWELDTWYGLFAPRGTSKAVADEINGHIGALLDDAANRKRYDENYYEPMRMPADAFAARIKTEAARWERIVKDTGIEVQ
jgi:tripartite-type tricarboxylate transporter receptor subunit TctC